MVNIEKPNCFILTGAPGTGKTAVLEELKSRGYTVFSEPAREILNHQLKIDGSALPAKNPQLFVEEMLMRSTEQLDSAVVSGAPVFFDRGIPDCVVYAQRFGIDPSMFELSAKECRYNPTVFIFPPWKEIFVNDEVRRLPFEKTRQVHALHVETYQGLGFTLKEVPFASVSVRADFVEARARKWLGNV